MTDKQQPEALRQAAWLKKEGASCQRHYDLGVLIERQHTELETLRARVQELEAHLILDCMTHVQNPAEIEHVAGDVSKNWAESNMSTQPAAQQEAQEPVYAFRRKGLDDFCTCTEKRYAELSAKPNLFETRIFYTAPQPTQAQAGAVPLTDEQIEDLLICGNPTDEEKRLIRMGWDAAHGIKGGQHGAE